MGRKCRQIGHELTSERDGAMKRAMKIRALSPSFVAVLLFAFASACGGAAESGGAPTTPEKTAAPTTDSLDAALKGEHRSAESKTRDAARHPQETLAFFGLTADMRVVELWPGGGWYTEVLAPVLKQRGELVAITPAGKYDGIYREFIAKRPDLYDRVQVVTVDPTVAGLKFGEAGSADLVVTFRNAHGWISNGYAESVFQAAFTVLRPGGVLGVVDHRAAATGELDGKSGYVSEAQVVGLAKAAGFELEATSEVNANPKDTKDYPEGVWTLPPSLRLGDKDREKYLAIGESDRMTLKFRKPALTKAAANAGNATLEKSAAIPDATSKDNPPN